MRRVRRIGGGVILALLALAARPAAGEESAWDLLAKVRQLNQTTRAWSDRSQRLDLTIVDRRKSESHREMEILTRKSGPDASRSILFFLAPAAVRGVGLLQWVEPQQADRQWLYLPELKRVRQITGSSKQDSFAGTDFSYEDLSIMTEILDWTEAKASATLRGDETIDGHLCAVIEFVPKDDDSAYGKVRLWLDRNDLVGHKFELDNRKGALAKVLLLSDIRLVKNIPTAHRLEMRNERSGSSTVVVFTKIEYDTGLSEDVFSQRRLERGI